ncbi:uncharacterized protein VTP21DRAFT_10285 [Calcarisporiella thermophila]|uniref:uncharacterized protein n=1 Tax=Calcarisporiella thermophila TaxID=911321 RepID=UPI003743A67D
MGFLEELKSLNFSIYAQWVGILSAILLVIFGILAVVTGANIVFGIIGLVLAAILCFIEIPFCLRWCPVSERFQAGIKFFENHFFRAALYLVFAVVIFLSRFLGSTGLIAGGVTLLLAAVFYAAAGFMKQEHAASSFTGGQSV